MKVYQKRAVNNVTRLSDVQNDLMTVHEVAVILRVDDTTVRRWIMSGTFDAVQLPHRGKRTAYRIHRSDVEKLLNQGEGNYDL